MLGHCTNKYCRRQCLLWNVYPLIGSQEDGNMLWEVSLQKPNTAGRVIKHPLGYSLIVSHSQLTLNDKQTYFHRILSLVFMDVGHLWKGDKCARLTAAAILLSRWDAAVGSCLPSGAWQPGASQGQGAALAAQPATLYIHIVTGAPNTPNIQERS